MNRRLTFHLSIQTHLSTLSILRELDGLLVAILNDAIHLPSSFDGNYRKCARLVGNQESCHIPPILRAALAIPDACGSLRGYGRNSLPDVHLKVGLGASDFGVWGELRPGVALGVRILNLRSDGLLWPDVETVGFGLGACDGGGGCAVGAQQHAGYRDSPGKESHVWIS